MNTRLLRKVAKHIAKEPKRLAMGDWIQRKQSPDDLAWDGYGDHSPHKFARCGTAACIAGWAIILSGKNETELSRTFSQEASELLDIPQANKKLFFVSSWGKFSQPYMDAQTPAARAKIAVQRIEWFIKTKGKE